jgi:DNA-binding LacI/PurR family transcriptional regulator
VLRRSRSRHIGVLFTMRQPFDIDLVEAIYPAADRHGYHVVLGALGPGRDERTAVEELLAYRCEAMILLVPATSGRSSPRADLLRRLGRREQSRAAYDRAIALAGNTAETAYLARRRDELADP